MHIPLLTEVLTVLANHCEDYLRYILTYAIRNAHINTVDVQFYQWDCDILVWQSVFSPGIICEIEDSSISLHFTVHDQTSEHNQNIKLRYAVHGFQESAPIMKAVK